MGNQTNFPDKNVAELFRTVEEKGMTFDEKRVEDLSREAEMPYINLQRQVIEQEALTLIPKPVAQTNQIICFLLNKGKKMLHVGVTEINNQQTQQVIEDLQKQYKVIVYLISEASFEHALSLYPLVLQVEEKRKGEDRVVITKSILEQATQELKNWPDLGQTIINKRIEDVVNILIAKAIGERASDIHLEPKEDQILLRLRIDGMMQDVTSFSPKIYPRLLSRFKLMAGLKLNITQIPQDGRFSVFRDAEVIDVRVSIVPTNYGETINMRMLGLEHAHLSKIQNLGLRKEEIKKIKKTLDKPSGMVLLTGATGSGKTTTLYAFLNYKKSSEIKIITLEDPIEYRLDGVSQIQISELSGLTFAKALRGILRQDPDVIMVGEIRDPETAEITIRAATTGHVVLSTLHAGSTAEIITQLENMGADSQNLSDVLNLLINQNLVRRLCQYCREPFAADPAIIEKMRKVCQDKFKVPDKLTLYQAKGCPQCNGIGYKGRIGIFEIMHVSEKIRALVGRRASPDEIHAQALAEGMILLIQDGLYKVMQGVTSMEELKRVV